MPYVIMLTLIAFCTVIFGDGDAFDKGWVALQRGDNERAIGLFDEATRSKDLSQANKGRAFNNIGVAWVAKGDMERAASQFDMAARFLPAEPVIQQNRVLASTAQRVRFGANGPDKVSQQATALEHTSAFGLPSLGGIRETVRGLFS